MNTYSIIKMKKNILINLFIIHFFLISAITYSQTIISMSGAVNYALEKNDKIKQYSEKIKQKQLDYKEAKGNFYPKVDLNVSYLHMDKNLEMDLNGIREVQMNLQAKNQVEFANIYNLLQGGSGLSQSQRALLFNQYYGQLNGVIPQYIDIIKKQDFWTTSVLGVQPLFLGGKLFAAKNYAENEIKYAEYELNKIKNEIKSEVIKNYLNVMLMQDIVQIRKDILETMNKHRDNAKRLFDEGVIAKNQYLRAEVAVADAERNLFDEENRLDLAITSLKNSINLKDNENIIILDTLVYKDIAESLEGFKLMAFGDNPIFNMLRTKKAETDNKFSIDRSELLPKVMLFGRFEFLDSYISSIEPRWFVGISASVNIFNGFKSWHKLETATLMKNEIDYMEADIKSKISLLVDKSYKEFLNARNKYSKLEVNINLANENLRLTSSRFQTGLGTSLDVIDAHLVLEKNLIDRKISLFEYYASLNDLYMTGGHPERFIEIWNKKENQ